MCQCGPTATGTPNTAGSSTECSPARWYPPPTNDTSASAYRSARMPPRSTTIAGPGDGEAGERVARAVEAFGPLRHAVVSRVPRDLERAAARPQLLQAAPVLFADRADAVERPVRRLRPAARGPAQPRAGRRDRG